MKRTISGVVVGMVLVMAVAAAEETNALFSSGLEITVISNAVVEPTTYDTVRVIQVGGPGCDDYGSGSNDVHAPFGISVHLGEAQSGVYATPSAECRQDGRSMWGHGYGQVNGETNRLISTIRGTRMEWGVYEVEVDFTPLGATRYTYEVWLDGILMLQATNQGEIFGVYTINVEDYNPRVNPVLLTASGPAAAIEFPYGTQFRVEQKSAVGDRLLILPEGVTNSVAYVSRADIFGSANLPSFDIADARIVMFGRPHKALGGVRWTAANSRLKAGPFTNELDGILVDFKNGATRWSAEIEPLALEDVGAVLSLSAAGESSSPQQSEGYLGPVGFLKSSGVVKLHADFYESSNTVLRVFRSNVLSGTILVPNGILATLGSTNPVVTGWTATTSNLTIAIAEATTVAGADGTNLEGDRFEFRPNEGTARVRRLFSAHVAAQAVQDMTIIGEQTTRFEPPEMRLKIERGEQGLIVSWPYHRAFYAIARTNVLVEPDGYPRAQYRDFRWYASILPTNAMEFISLRHTYWYYFDP